mgnify:CR=1 FL=1
MHTKANLIVTVKNRKDHFVKAFPFMVSQYGIDYDLVVVNFHSNDNFEEAFNHEVEYRRDTFSPNLKKINHIKLLEDLKFNARKARNLGAFYCKGEDSVLAFSDADVFVGVSYLSHWSNKVEKGNTFVTTRVQDTKASRARRIKKEINYGNFLAASEDFFNINGFYEDVKHRGGEDDEIYHRFKLLGMREINPHDSLEARQYSIMHEDEIRYSEFEISTIPELKVQFERIYNITDPYAENSNFLNAEFVEKISKREILYEKIS